MLFKGRTPKFPEEWVVFIGYAYVQCRLVTKTEMRRQAMCGPENPTPLGIWDADTNEILIGRWVSTTIKRRVLGHEIMHALVDYGMEV